MPPGRNVHFSETWRACYSSAMVLSLEDLERRVTVLERTQGETAETLRWVVAKLARLQAVQDEHTLRLERLEARLERVEARLENMETRLESVEGKLDTLPRAIAELIDASEKRIMAFIARR